MSVIASLSKALLRVKLPGETNFHIMSTEFIQDLFLYVSDIALEFCHMYRVSQVQILNTS